MMRLRRETKTDLLAVLALTIALLVALATPVIIRHAKTYEDPSLFWCKTLRESGSNLSCDWDNDEIPRAALKYWHEGMGPQEATLRAIQDYEASCDTRPGETPSIEAVSRTEAPCERKALTASLDAMLRASCAWRERNEA